MKKIVITGGSGFVGSNILKHLLNKNLEITIILRKNSFIEKNIIKNCQVHYVDDIFHQDYDWWLNIFKEVDIVIHSAWYVKHGKYLMSEKNLECLYGSICMAIAASEAKVSSFVGLGTCFEYDFEYCDKILSIETPLNPKTPYSLSKVSLLNTLRTLQLTSKMNYCWCRLFYLYGEGEDKNRLMPYINQKLKNGETVFLTNGEKIRDYIHISEATKLIIEIVLNKLYGEHNICSGKGKSIKEIAEVIAAKYDRNDLLKFGKKDANRFEPLKIIGSPSKIKYQ